MAGNNTNNNGLTNSETGFSIYPNPASENVELHYNLTEGENILEINTKGLSSGIYMYGLFINNEMIEFKKMILK